MAIGQKVNTFTGEFEIELPDGAKTGVIWYIQSRNAPEPKKIERLVGTEAIAQKVASGATDFDPAKDTGFITHFLSSNSKILAACVTGWDWHGEEFKEGEGSPEFSYENVLSILDDPEGEFIIVQLAAAVETLGKPKAAPKKPA